MNSTKFYYSISRESTRANHILFNVKIKIPDSDVFQIQLPAWRPGRYEISNYAQYIKDFAVNDETGKKCRYKKTHHSVWEIDAKGKSEVTISYSFYTDRIDAGFSFVDEDQIYLNPVNCFFYIKNQPCQYELSFDVPDNYKVYSPLDRKSKKVYKANSYYELFDSPTIVSRNALVSKFKVGKTTIKNVFQGKCRPNLKKMNRDFSKFIALQIKCFGDLPIKEFSFLNQITSHLFFHGVEHKKNTVLAYGPGFLLNQDKGYQRFLGLACHEFYHIWNVKHLRPSAMHPYDFSQENIHTIGYIIEGVTTYQGDVKLWQSKVIDNNVYFELLGGEIDKHLNNAGRFNQSIRESSIDLWLDGYKPGIPGKKVSIYTEGCLLALMTDILLLEKTEGKYGLDDVMKDLYQRFAKKGLGYNEKEYADTIKNFGGSFFNSLYKRLIDGANSYENDLRKVLSKVGITLIKNPINNVESYLGIKIDDSAHPKILAVLSGSPAENSGLTAGCKIHSINNVSLDKNLDDWLGYFKNEKVSIDYSLKGSRKTALVLLSNEIQYASYSISIKSKVTTKENKLLKYWRKH